MVLLDIMSRPALVFVTTDFSASCTMAITWTIELSLSPSMAEIGVYSTF